MKNTRPKTKKQVEEFDPSLPAVIGRPIIYLDSPRHIAARERQRRYAARLRWRRENAPLDINDEK